MTGFETNRELDDEMAFSLDNGKYYFSIQTYEDGYDYTIYSQDFSDFDGGQLDDPDLTMEEAIQDILEEFGLADLPRVPYDYDELLARTDEVQQARIAKVRVDLKAPLDSQIHSASTRAAASQPTSQVKAKEPEPEI